MKLEKSNRTLGRVRAAPPQYRSPKELEEKVNEYFEVFERMGGMVMNRQGNYIFDESGEPLYKPRPITKLSLANFLGYASWQNLSNAMSNRGEAYKYILEAAENIILSDLVENGLQNNYNHAIITLVAKFQHNWKDNEKPKDDEEEMKGLKSMTNEELMAFAELKRKALSSPRQQDEEFRDAIVIDSEPQPQENGDVLG